MKGLSVRYDVGCTMGLTLGHGAWQIDRPSNGSMWNSYSFQPVGQGMGYSFSDLVAEGCCRSLNALLNLDLWNLVWECSLVCRLTWFSFFGKIQNFRILANFKRFRVCSWYKLCERDHPAKCPCFIVLKFGTHITVDICCREERHILVAT